MPAVKTSRPSPAIRQVLEELRRVTKHQNDNFDQLNQHWSLLQNSSTKDFTTFQHGVLKEIPNAFYPAIPTGFQPLACYDTTTGLTPQPTPVSWTFTPSQRDGWVGLTLYWDLKHTEPCMVMTKSAVQSIANNTTTTITGWDTTQFSRGSVITTDGTTFTLSEAGTYHVTLLTTLATGVTYTACQTWIDAPTTQEVAFTSLQAAFTDGPYLQVSGIMRIATAATCIGRIYQTNAAAAARNLGSGSSATRIAFNRLYNDTTPSAKVVGYLIGP